MESEKVDKPRVQIGKNEFLPNDRAIKIIDAYSHEVEVAQESSGFADDVIRKISEKTGEQVGIVRSTVTQILGIRMDKETNLFGAFAV